MPSEPRSNQESAPERVNLLASNEPRGIDDLDQNEITDRIPMDSDVLLSEAQEPQSPEVMPADVPLDSLDPDSSFPDFHSARLRLKVKEGIDFEQDLNTLEIHIVEAPEIVRHVLEQFFSRRLNFQDSETRETLQNLISPKHAKPNTPSFPLEVQEGSNGETEPPRRLPKREASTARPHRLLIRDPQPIEELNRSPIPTGERKILRCKSRNPEHALRDTSRKVNSSCYLPELNYQLHNGDLVCVTFSGRPCLEMIRNTDDERTQRKEVGGLLFGFVDLDRVDEKSRRVHRVYVTDTLQFPATQSTANRVYFDHECWIYANEVSDRKFEPVGKKRLGWYHTHPTQGLFFSSHDHDVHQIFRQPYQFGLVIDPRVMEAEAYFWTDPEHRTQTNRSVRISLRGQSGQPRSTKSKRSKQARTFVDQSRDGPISLWGRCQELWKELLLGFAILVLVVLIWVQRSKGDSLAPKHTDKSHSQRRLTHP